MTQLEELAVDFLVWVFYLFVGTIVGSAILAVGATVEHFTP